VVMALNCVTFQVVTYAVVIVLSVYMTLFFFYETLSIGSVVSLIILYTTA
jgi:hypothetical protein